METIPQPPFLGTDRENDRLVLSLEGDWTLEHATPDLEEKLEKVLADCQIREVRFKTDRLHRWDSRLLIPLLRLRNACTEHQIQIDPAELPEGVRGLLKLSDEAPDAKEFRERKEPANVLEKLGTVSLAFWEDLTDFRTFVGDIVLAFGRLLSGTSRMRRQDFLLVVQDTGANALPIVALISLLIGLIVAFLGAVVLLQFGAAIYVSYLVGYGMLREMSSVMTGVIIAGRTGAAFAAQLGSMKASEEIDALRTLGINPIDFLVLPRVLGLFLMMPLLVIFSNVIGILGGLLVAVTMLELAPQQYFSTMNDAAGTSDLLLGVFKGIVFGGLIAVAGCLRGMQSGSNADAVGRATTSAVVTSITLIILFNTIIDWIAATFGF